MGQCSSTLPTNHSNNVGGMVSETTTPMTGGTASSTNQYDMRDRDVVLSDHHNHHNKRGNHPSSTSNGNKSHALDFNILTPTTNVNDPMKSRKTMNHSKNSKSSSYYHHNTSDLPPSPQSRDPPTNHYNNSNSVSPMDIDTRDEAASPVPMTTTNQQQLYNYQFMIPSQLKYPLPANAVRTRCYKLNLNAEPIGFSSNSSAATPSKPMFLGPFTETLPTLTFSNDTYDKDDDDDDDDNDGMTKEGRDIAVAIQTAQIFRGITVSPDGTILSQNARATRSSRGNNTGGSSSAKVKLSEKSRQAAKIDKANDLIEQDGSSDAKLVSLVVIGEYDDMKYLVRDGSRKLREADGLPDDALYAINRPRVSSRLFGGRSPTSQSSAMNNNPSMFTSSNNIARGGVNSSSTVVSSSSSSRRRRVAGNNTPSSIIPTDTPSKSQQLSSPQQLPKLKSNPRDTTSSTQRRTIASSTPKDSTSGGLRGIRLDSCHDFMDVHTRNNNNNNNNNTTSANSNIKNSTVISGFGSDNDDWTHAWNLWNCGGGNVGTTSPLQPSSPSSATNNNNNHKMGQQHHDSRNDTSSSTNYGGYSSRRVG